ncbi:MAG: DUF554 domain-containing protein [Dethiosulfatibacter sp.]|nr:DUF554 domain-containing protein [Dethiosulfatibacter sp.]
MLGTIVNTIAIIVGSLVGLVFKNLIPEKYNDTIMKSMSLAVILIGLQMALGTQNILLVICSMVGGSLVGERIDIEKKLDNIGAKLQDRFSKTDSNIGQGFVTASLMYCIGSLAIIGAIEGGLLGKHDVLFAKSLIDGIVSVALTATMGIGVIFASVSVFLYQGSIVLISSFAKDILTDAIVTEMSAIGGLLIMGIGLNILMRDRIKVGNMLPALFVPLVFMGIMNIIG